MISWQISSVFASKWTTRDGRNRLAVAKGKLDWRANLYPRIDYHLARALKPRDEAVVTTGWLRGVGTRAVDAFKPDVLHLHWIDHGMLSIADLEMLSNSGIPIVWTLHDMAPAAGGFGFRESVGLSPSPFGPMTCQDSRRHGSESIIRRRTAALAKANLTVVAPSRWLGEEARRSPVFANHRIETIPYGIDTGKFRPVDRKDARGRWHLGMNEKVILFGADTFEDKRKGLHHLAAALGRTTVAKTGWRVVGFGNRQPIPDDRFPIPATGVGRVQSSAELASLYSAADVFACPSREDNLPNTMLESLACGTPVVGFDVGGIPDFIRPGISGALAPRYDEGALAYNLCEILGQDTEAASSMRLACRNIAVEELALEHQASRYLEIYQEMLAALRSA